MLHQFGLRTGSAGEGKWHGGEGVIRDIEFMEPMQVSILSEVRHFLHADLNSYRLFCSVVRDSLMVWRVEVLPQVARTRG